MFSEKLLPMDVAGTVHVMNYKLDVANMFTGNDEDKESYRRVWTEYLENNRDALDRYLYYPMSCRYQKVLAVFDPGESEIVDIVPVYTERAESEIMLTLTEDELELADPQKSEMVNRD